MNSIARKYHQVAMDLYDFGKIYKAKGNPKYYQGNLQLAYLLDKQAAISVQSEAVDVLWQAVYPRSASWLAYECGKYIEAKELAELGLKHKKNISDYEIMQLQNLLEKAKKEIEKGNSQKEKELVPNSILAIASAANIDQYLQIRQIKTDQNSLVKIASEDSLQLTKSFLGDMVEIEIKANENGELTLKDIRRAA